MDNRKCPHCGQRMELPVIVEQIINKGYGEVGDIKMLTRGRIEATDKEIYNAIGNLKRRGRIRRLGYGQYASLTAAEGRGDG